MPARQVFAMQNDFTQDGNVGICTIASLQWCRQCLRLGRGIGSYAEMSLSDHQLNALMSVWRRYDNDAQAQTQAMGLRIEGGADRVVHNIMAVNAAVENSASGQAIFWNSHHTMGYAVRARGGGQEYEFFDNEAGLYLSNNPGTIALAVNRRFNVGGYAPIEGMRIVMQ